MTITKSTTTEYEIPINDTQSGEFYIGDLGYVIKDQDEWVNQYCANMDDGIHQYKGMTYAWFSTGGDGQFIVYEDQTGDDDFEPVDCLPVDAGCIGIIPMELVTDKDAALEHGIIMTSLDDAVYAEFSEFDMIDISGLVIPISWKLQEQFSAKYPIDN